ncbi:MAG: hypothetical protein NTZ05_23425 [Chloroflexi bacterium]|nr:hypothetical protein [Chloroflexota bacterium]
MIVSQYPTAVFHVTEAPDEPDSIDLLAFVECEDTDEVMDLVIDRLIEMTVEERLPIHVIPLQATADSHPGTIR